jgi:hypothetical protein
MPTSCANGSTASPVPDDAGRRGQERADRLARIQRRFAEFAAEYAALPLYSALCRNLAGDAETASLLLAARPGQARPVLWLAALHELVLRRADTPAARWYPSVVGQDSVPQGDPWPDVRRTVLEHRDELVERIATSATQTNEVNRAVYVSVGLAAAAADLAGTPIALVELGASAGLLLGIDRYTVDLVGADRTVTLGDPASPVRCLGVDRAEVGAQLAVGPVLPPVVARVGLDLSPVDLNDDDAVRWLEACLWPDVRGRVERFRAARALLRPDPPVVLAGDMVDDIDRAVWRARDAAGTDAHVVVMSSWAITYVAAPRRLALETRLSTLARDLSALSWLTAEPPACAPGISAHDLREDGGGTVVGLRRWRGGRELEPVVLGTCNPHGQWVDLSLRAVDNRTS